MKHLEVDELLATAQQRTGLSDFGPVDFLEPLTVFIAGLNAEAQIADDRFDRLYERLQRLLINRLWFAKDLREHPEILNEDVGSPIVIASLPRTGSTKLHRLLAASGDFQFLPFWKVHMPARVAGELDGGIARRIEATREHERWMYQTSPAILTGHPQFTEEAEEDQWLMEQTFRHPLLFGMFQSTQYLLWLARADMSLSFDYLLQQLKYLQWQMPERGKPWLLKSPTHFGSEQQLQRIYEQPRFIITHRDPAICMSSITSTSMAARRLYSDLDSGATMAANVTTMFSQVANAHIQWRDTNPQVPVLDVAFREINADGLASARKVYEFAGMTLSAEAERRMRQWEQKSRLEHHGKATYSAEAFGTTDNAIRGAFADYIERFSSYL